MFVEDDDKPVLCHVQKNVSSIRRLLCEHYMNFKVLYTRLSLPYKFGLLLIQ